MTLPGVFLLLRAVTVFIYTLTDPRTNEVRYVGKAVNIKRRLNEHLFRDKGCHKWNWLQQLVTEGLRPTVSIIDVIENSDDTDWQAREVYWIAHYRRIGAPLTNLDSGGRRGKCMSAESRRKCSEASRGRVKSVETREKLRLINLGRKMPREAVEKSRKANLGRKASPETKAKMSAARKGKKRPGVGAKISAALMGRTRPPEVVAKLKAALTGRKLTEAHKTAIALGLARRRDSI